MSKRINYISDLSPEVLYYNIVYKIRNRFGIDEELEKSIENIIKRNVVKWETDTKES